MKNNNFNSKRGFIMDSKILFKYLINQKLNNKNNIKSKINLKSSCKNNLNKNNNWKNIKNNILNLNKKIRFNSLDKFEKNEKFKDKSQQKENNFIKFNKNSIGSINNINKNKIKRLNNNEVISKFISRENNEVKKKNIKKIKSINIYLNKEKNLNNNLKNLKNCLVNDNKLRMKRKNLSNKIMNYNQSCNNLLNNLNYNIFDNFKFKNILGTGNFSEVRLVYDKKNENYKAVKIWKKYQFLNRNIFKLYFNEKNILSNLNFKYIIKFYFLYENLERIFLFLEYFKSYDLKSYLEKENLKLNEKIKIIKKLAETINYLHNNNVIHRDIKLENILINNQHEIKLIDFGFSYVLKEKITTDELFTKELVNIKDNNKDEEIKTFCGTPLYMAPEILNNILGDKKSDIWSFGILIFRIIFNKFPFYSKNIKKLYKNIKYNKLIIPNFNSNEIIKKIIKGSLKKKLSKRFEINDILNLLKEFD